MRKFNFEYCKSYFYLRNCHKGKLVILPRLINILSLLPHFISSKFLLPPLLNALNSPFTLSYIIHLLFLNNSLTKNVGNHPLITNLQLHVGSRFDKLSSYRVGGPRELTELFKGALTE
ncbi:uncharacterized protein LOC130014786 [Mercurialis annua]|uniref:uncharacterized protein LOC126678027 n=1 Tax=Mercurialis annua TaxID=3986 RepID=UPI002160A64A|nr:uncharacterized protein LOC126678027 [Mercurialis annua]XP_055959653.1 uncharacterized protein LOC130014786 [Mercurialis annua]